MHIYITITHLISIVKNPPNQIRNSVTLSLSPFKRPFSRWIWVSRYQNVSILDFIGAKDDGGGGDKWSYKTCKASVKLSLPTEIRNSVTLRSVYLHLQKYCENKEQFLHKLSMAVLYASHIGQLNITHLTIRKQSMEGS